MKNGYWSFFTLYTPLTPNIYQIFSGLVFSPPELRLQCLKIYFIEGLYRHGHALKFAWTMVDMENWRPTSRHLWLNPSCYWRQCKLHLLFCFDHQNLSCTGWRSSGCCLYAPWLLPQLLALSSCSRPETEYSDRCWRSLIHSTLSQFVWTCWSGHGRQGQRQWDGDHADHQAQEQS